MNLVNKIWTGKNVDIIKLIEALLESPLISEFQDEDLMKMQNRVSIVNMIFNLSQTYVPVDTGRLKESGHIEYGEDGKFRIVYDCLYSMWVHEIMEYRHASPTKAKFLEDAAYEVQSLVQQGNNVPFTFMFYTDGHRIWLDLDTVDGDTFRLNEYIKSLYINSLRADFNKGVEQGG